MSNQDFLIGFFSMTTYLILTSVVGGAIGIGSGVVIAYSPRLTQATIRLLQLGLWAPFLASWVFHSSFFAGIAAVVLASCYYYLAARFAGLVPLQVGRATVMQALLIFLITQGWLGPNGWVWFTEEYLGYSILIILGLLFLINWAFSSDFERAATERAAIVRRELRSKGGFPWMGVLLASFCLILPLLVASTAWKDTGVSVLEIFLGLVLSGG